MEGPYLGVNPASQGPSGASGHQRVPPPPPKELRAGREAKGAQGHLDRPLPRGQKVYTGIGHAPLPAPATGSEAELRVPSTFSYGHHIPAIAFR